MAENNAVTKEDLQSTRDDLLNAVSNVVAQLTKLVQETAAATEAKLTTEMDRRFDVVNKRFRRADRQRKEFREEMENQLHEIRAKVLSRFDRAELHADEAVEKLGRTMTTKLDRIAGVIDIFRTEQLTMGSIEDKLRDDLEESKKTNGAAIDDLNRRVTVLEAKVLASPEK
jgi:hypothetical protein